mmetsp:Transcript_4421/g.12677  ORF Transcript_4421/g.12677 Transcript_4421/m.12677 type:complete len:403 (+) Transcript_4421:1017-2225(+)
MRKYRRVVMLMMACLWKHAVCAILCRVAANDNAWRCVCLCMNGHMCIIVCENDFILVQSFLGNAPLPFERRKHERRNMHLCVCVCMCAYLFDGSNPSISRINDQRRRIRLLGPSCVLVRHGLALEGRDALALHPALLHLLLELSNVANARKEVGLAAAVRVERRKPPVPVLLRSVGLLEVADHGEALGREEAVVDDAVVPPLVGGSRHVVGRLLLEVGAVVEIELVALDVVELEAVSLEDAPDAAGLHPKEGGEEEMEAASHDPDQRRGSIECVRWMVPHDQRPESGDRHGQRVVGIDHHILSRPLGKDGCVLGSLRGSGLARWDGLVAPVIAAFTETQAHVQRGGEGCIILGGPSMAWQWMAVRRKERRLSHNGLRCQQAQRDSRREAVRHGWLSGWLNVS